jgi:lipoprotein-releasing system permease protein
MYKIILAIRYLIKRRISYFSIAATALCVFVVFVVITVLSGLTAEFKKNTYLSVGDCVISSRSLVGFAYYEEFAEELRGADFVKAVSPVIKNYALVKELGTARSFDRTVEILGIEPVAYSQVTSFGRWLYYHRNDVSSVFRPSYDANLPGCVPGIALLFDRDSDGKYIITEDVLRKQFEITSVPLTAKGALAKAGAGEVSTKVFYCSDYTQSGIRADWSFFYLPFDDAQSLCGMVKPNRANAIFVKFREGVGLEAGCDKVKALWSGFVKSKRGVPLANLLRKVKVQSWKIYSRDVVAVAETQESVMILCFGMIGIITVFIVFVVFYMIVSHKRKDIGILKSIGVSKGGVLSLFLGFGFLVGVVGSAIGAVGGWQFLIHINQVEDWLFKHFGFQVFTRRLYAIGDIPNAVDLKVLGVIILSAVAACLIGAVIPSWQAARLRPVETLQVSQL